MDSSLLHINRRKPHLFGGNGYRELRSNSDNQKCQDPRGCHESIYAVSGSAAQ